MTQQSRGRSNVELRNSGFFAKSVTVSYERPKMTSVSLGQVPDDFVPDPVFNMPYSGPQGFVESTKENPIFPKGVPLRSVREQTPVLNKVGQPEMESVTKKIRVAGSKGLALKRIAARTLKFALGFAALPGAILTLGTVGVAMAGVFSTATGLATYPPSLVTPILATAGAVVAGAGIGLATGVIKNRKLFTTANTLSWEKTDIKQPIKLKGYEHKSWGSIKTYKPILETKTIGEWDKPVVQHS